MDIMNVSQKTTQDAQDGLSTFVVSTDSDLLALRDEWNELVENDGRATIFQTWEFQYHAWRMLSETVSLHLVLVRDETGALIGCAPLGIHTWRKGPLSVRVLAFSGFRYSDYSDFIVLPDRAQDALAALAEWFSDNTRRWDVVELMPVREDSWARHDDWFLSKVRVLSQTTPYRSAPYLGFQPGWSSYEDALSRKRAKATRYQVRKLLRRAEGRFQTAISGEALEDALRDLIDLHQKRMRQKHQVGMFADPVRQACFRSLIKGLAARGLAKVHSISSNGRTIASDCVFQFRGSVAAYQGGFDPEFYQLSPGTVNQALIINEALSAGAVEYDFLIGDEAWKYEWTNEERQLYRIEFSTKSWRRFPYHWADTLRVTLSRSERLRRLNLWLRAWVTKEL